MVEKDIRGRICHCFYRFAKANNKYLYGWAMSQKLPLNNYEWIEDTSRFHEDFIKNYNEKSDKEYFLEFDVQYIGKLHELHNDLPFLPERIKIEKVDLHDKNEYFIHIRNLKQALNHGLVFTKN